MCCFEDSVDCEGVEGYLFAEVELAQGLWRCSLRVVTGSWGRRMRPGRLGRIQDDLVRL